LVEMAAASVYLFQEFDSYDEKAAKKNFTAGSDEVLAQLHDQFAALIDWESEALHQVIINLAESLGLGLGKVAQPLRVAVCGSGVSPAIDATIALLGKEKTLARILRAVAYIKLAA